MLQHWSLEDACAEYVHFCRHKQREVDKQYIERFDPRTLADARPPSPFLAPWLSASCTEYPSALQAASQRGQLDGAATPRMASGAAAVDGVRVLPGCDSEDALGIVHPPGAVSLEHQGRTTTTGDTMHHVVASEDEAKTAPEGAGAESAVESSTR